jgi:hypothetical protein
MATQDLDVVLKSLISGTGDDVLDYLAGTGKVAEWLNVELPLVRNPRVDLLARVESGELVHVELHNTHEMNLQRMLEYGVGIWRQVGVFPRQLLLYVGNEPLRVVNHIKIRELEYGFEVLDIRDVDAERMAESDSVALSLLAVLAGRGDRTKVVQRIIMRIGSLDEGRRADALRKLLILAGLRGIARQVEEENKRMPLTYDIMDNEVLGPAIRKGIEEGRIIGRQEGLEQGLQHEHQVLRLQLEKRFGPLPVWAEERLAKSTAKDAETLAVRILDARSLEELFG